MCQSRRLLYRVKQFDGNAQCLQWGMADIKSMFPPIVFPPKTFLEQVGTGAIAKIVLHHHRLLRHSSISHMYPSDEAQFLEGVAKATHFLIEALGGEKMYTYSYGSPMLCRTHAPFAIDEQARFVWLEAYKQTLHDLAFPKEWVEVFWNWIESFSLRMVNKRNLSLCAYPTRPSKGSLESHEMGNLLSFERFNSDASDAIENQMKLIELADAMRFDEVWLGEHHFNDFSICPSPSLLLAHVAARTKHVRLGVAGFLAPFYDAIRLAEEVAMLDILSHGRMNLGFAKGAFAPDSKHFNVTKEQLRPRMWECVDAVSQLLHIKGRPVGYEGAYMNFAEVDIEPKPLQEKIPIYIATFVSDETILYAAQKGFGLMLSQGVDVEECVRVSTLYESVAGVKPEIVLLRTFYISECHASACVKARPMIEHFAKSMRAASAFNKSPCFNRRHYEALIAERNTFFDGQKFFECGIIGDAQACIEKINAIADALCNVTIALKPLGADLFESVDLLRKFNETVRPYCEATKEVV